MYHVVGEGWNPGEALYCWDELEAMGYAPSWKFEGEPTDTDVVCLFESREEAEEFAAEFGGTILTVRVPEDAYLLHVSEGYPAIGGHIPAEWIGE